MYSKLLVEMLTNRDDHDLMMLDFDHLEGVEPEIKCILYECYHAKDRTDQREHQRYEQEISRFIQKESEKTFHQERLQKDREAFMEK